MSSDGLRAIRLAVVLYLIATIVSGWIWQAIDVPGLDLASKLQSTLVISAAAAAMWDRRRLALALAALIAALALWMQPTGDELFVLLILAVTNAFRANVRTAMATIAGFVAYGIALGFRTEQVFPGSGVLATSLIVGIAAAGSAAGLTLRVLIKIRDRRRNEIQRTVEAQPQIRAAERARLAGELQVLVTDGLSAVQRESARAATNSAELRRALDAVDARSRALLQQLRSLLGVLRQDPDPGPTVATVDEPQRLTPRLADLLIARHIRIAFTVLFALLALRATLGLRSPIDLGDLIQLLGWAACSLALLRHRLGLLLAGSALVIALFPSGLSFWVALPIAVVVLLSGLRGGTRRIWLILVGLTGYALAVGLTSQEGGISYGLVVVSIGVATLAIATVTRHLLAAQEQARQQEAELEQARFQAAIEERNALARELHDVVARQLSLSTMQIMATSAANDPDTLLSTLDQVATNAAVAREELDTLVKTMRSTAGAVDEHGPPAQPHQLAVQLADDLTGQGFRTEFAVSHETARLDPPMQRTVGRVMQEATTNILRYAPPGATCRYVLDVGPTTLRLRIENSLAAARRSSTLSMGWGLLGLGERIDLLGGTFTAGPDHDRWVVEADLPLTPTGSPSP